MRAIGHAGVVCLALLAMAAPCRGSDAPPVISGATQSFLEGLQASGKWSELETQAVVAGVERAPALLPAALEGVAGTPGRPLSPKERAELGADLLLRVKLQAIAEGMVELDDAQEQRLQPFVAMRASPTLRIVDLPKAVDRSTVSALALDTKIARPSCPSGTTTVFVGGQKACREGDPWTRALFNAVVPISVSGKGTCTGTALSLDTILTAAHCVLESGPSGVMVVAASRISVKLPTGQLQSIVSAPLVPAEMLHDCLPICPTPGFDFAVLKILATPGAALSPLPSFRGFSSTGPAAITMAGYGISTLPASASGDGLAVGSQTLASAQVDQSLEWSFALSDAAGSTFCQGDSGGPIFLGRPRKAGDALELVGVISKFAAADDSVSCLNSRATAVNLSRPAARTEFCRLVGTAQPGC